MSNREVFEHSSLEVFSDFSYQTQITEHLEIKHWDTEGIGILCESNVEQEFPCASSSILRPVLLKRQVVVSVSAA